MSYGKHVITTFFKGNYHEKRFNEIMTCLRNNLKNEQVTRVHLLWEDEDPMIHIKDPALRAKLVSKKVDKQPTYQQMFDYASDVCIRVQFY